MCRKNTITISTDTSTSRTHTESSVEKAPPHLVPSISASEPREIRDISALIINLKSIVLVMLFMPGGIFESMKAVY